MHTRSYLTEFARVSKLFSRKVSRVCKATFSDWTIVKGPSKEDETDGDESNYCNRNMIYFDI